MKLKTSVPISTTLQLCLFDNNLLLVRESTAIRSLLVSWRHPDYPENPNTQVIDDVGGLYEEAFQQWRNEQLTLLRGAVDSLPRSPEVPAPTNQERITMLEHAVQKLMDDKKAAATAARAGVGGVLGRPAKSMAEAAQAALDQEAAERYMAFRRTYQPPFVDEMPGEAQWLAELLTSLGYQVSVVRH